MNSPRKVNALSSRRAFPKILLVDDSSVLRNEIKAMLSGSQYIILEANDGVEGCRMVMTNHDIDLIFLDINMPNMDGLTMAAKLHQDAQNKIINPIPVVMLTTESSMEKVQKGRAAGVVGWLIKPPKLEHVLKTIEKILGK